MLQYIIYKHNQLQNEVGMDQDQKTMSDDQELAKVLAGVSQAADDNLSFEETSSTPTLGGSPAPISPVVGVAAPVVNDPAQADLSTPTITTSSSISPAPTADPALDSIKQTALNELRPLVDKLDVSPEEKFDTYLLLLRSTDDRDLISPAHDAAVAITDEARRAQALLDIIKEIDYLSAPRA